MACLASGATDMHMLRGDLLTCHFSLFADAYKPDAIEELWMDKSPLTLVHVYSPKTVLLLWVMDAVWL